MPITPADIKFKLSTSAGPGLSNEGFPNSSLGGFASYTEMAAGPNTLFDNISGAENTAQAVDYRCFFVHNDHNVLTLMNAVVYLSAEIAGGAEIAIAVDNIAASPETSSSPQAAVITNEANTPVGTTPFSSPTSAATGLALGNIPPNSVRGVWVRRTATNSPPLTTDGVTFGLSGDTAD